MSHIMNMSRYIIIIHWIFTNIAIVKILVGSRGDLIWEEKRRGWNDVSRRRRRKDWEWIRDRILPSRRTVRRELYRRTSRRRRLRPICLCIYIYIYIFFVGRIYTRTRSRFYNIIFTCAREIYSGKMRVEALSTPQSNSTEKDILVFAIPSLSSPRYRDT